MNNTTQVNKSHYDFLKYVTPGRWASMWNQLSEVIALKPQRVLEIGPGPGVFKQTAKLFGVEVETLDLDPNLLPDHVGSMTSLPFPDNAYDVVCAFQVLEHLPYEQALTAFREMCRVANGHVVISLPDAEIVWRYQFHIPKIGSFDLLIPRPFGAPRVHEFDGEHYWEINKKGYQLARICADFEAISHLTKTYRFKANPYHRFFVFSRVKNLNPRAN